VSATNVEIARRVAAAYADGDIESVRPCFAPDFAMEQLPSHPDAGVFEGLGAAGQSMQEWEAMFDDFSWEAEEFVAAGDHVVVIVLERGFPRGGGRRLEHRFGLVFTFREGRIARMQWCHSRAEALELAGL
jgi:ketosteroid isomerase-like protein